MSKINAHVHLTYAHSMLKLNKHKFTHGMHKHNHLQCTFYIETSKTDERKKRSVYLACQEGEKTDFVDVKMFS